MEWILGWIVMVGLAMIFGPIWANSLNKKERNRKLALLKEHPELAKEIWQSIEDQDVHFRKQMDAYNQSFGEGIDKMGASFQKSAERRRKGRSMALKLGLAVARKLGK